VIVVAGLVGVVVGTGSYLLARLAHQDYEFGVREREVEAHKRRIREGAEAWWDADWDQAKRERAAARGRTP
jgi:hypothetical protein